MQERNAYHRIPQPRSPIMGLLGLANAIIMCIFPMVLLYMVFLSCGDNSGSHTSTALSVTNRAATSGTRAPQAAGTGKTLAEDNKQLVGPNIIQVAGSYAGSTADQSYPLVNGTTELSSSESPR